MLANTLSRLIDHQLTEPKPPEKEGHEYGYVLLEWLPDIHVGSSKHTPLPPVIITNINGTNDSNAENVENIEIHFSLNSEKLTVMQNDNTLCVTILKSINEKMSSEGYFVNDKKFLAQSCESKR